MKKLYFLFILSRCDEVKVIKYKKLIKRRNIPLVLFDHIINDSRSLDVMVLNDTVAHSAVVPRIPAHLVECYRGGGPYIGAPRRLDVFLSLVRKLELASPFDMRMFNTALLKSLRLDGIEQAADIVETEIVLPFRATAFQFHKYKFLMDVLIPGQSVLETDEILLPEEKCLLHRMLSSTVQPWERGDEHAVCPTSVEQRQSMVTQGSTRIRSRCPIEDGVVHTDWGTISPGTIVAAVASSLEPQTVSVTDILNANIFREDIAEPLLSSARQEWVEDIETLDATISERQSEDATISNIWSATISGDLSEIVINQGPRFGARPQSLIIGSNNRWNDTLLPRDYYLLSQNASLVDWHFTDAEILGGIDGLILAHYIPKWVEERRTLRLSQIIDMYYSSEGVSFTPSVKACNRQALFQEIFNSADLLAETVRFAHVLSLRQITVYIPVEEMQRIAEAAVTAFVNYFPTVLRQHHRSCPVSHSVPVMDLIVATDGSWRGYDVEEFMSWVGSALELNFQRSSLGLLHGNTGQWIVPPSDNMTAVFSHINNFTDEWPNRLNLPNIVSTTIEYSLNKTLLDVERQASAGPSTVVLVISPSDNPSAQELERSRELMTTLRAHYFDVYFAYVAQDLTDFQNINNDYMDYSEFFLTISSTTVQDVVTAVDTYLIKNEIPTRLIGAHCPFNGTAYNQIEFEDFVLPSRVRSYRIHPFYMRQQGLVNIKFRNNGQGKLLICTWRGIEESHKCQTVAERDVCTFNLTTPCPSLDFCLPAYFVVMVNISLNLCANNDCRLPDQVGYYVQHAGLRCLPLRNKAIPTATSYLHSSLVLVLMFLSNKYYPIFCN